ncbi:MAG: LysM peptidoglycan-binding domain-containing protein [Cyclobacteriaceae bacterium]
MGCIKLTYYREEGLEGCTIFLGERLKEKKGQTENRVEYHPFGTTAYRSGRNQTETSLKRYRYVGKERDDETGLYYYGARYYAAWLARFISTDPLKDEYPYYTSYQYAGNRPINFIDLDGLEPALPEHAQGSYNEETGQYTAAGGGGNKGFDTLHSIADRFSVTVDDLKTANRLSGDSIEAGQILNIPQVNIDQQISILAVREFPGENGELAGLRLRLDVVENISITAKDPFGQDREIRSLERTSVQYLNVALNGNFLSPDLEFLPRVAGMELELQGKNTTVNRGDSIEKGTFPTTLNKENSAQIGSFLSEFTPDENALSVLIKFNPRFEGQAKNFHLKPKTDKTIIGNQVIRTNLRISGPTAKSVFSSKFGRGRLIGILSSVSSSASFDPRKNLQATSSSDKALQQDLREEKQNNRLMQNDSLFDIRKRSRIIK